MDFAHLVLSLPEGEGWLWRSGQRRPGRGQDSSPTGFGGGCLAALKEKRVLQGLKVAASGGFSPSSSGGRVQGLDHWGPARKGRGKARLTRHLALLTHSCAPVESLHTLALSGVILHLKTILTTGACGYVFDLL